MKKIIFKIYNIFYSYIIEPIYIVALVLAELTLLAIKRAKKIINNYISSDVLLLCFILSLIYRALFKFFIKKFSFELLIIIFLVAIISTLFKVTILISKGQECTWDIVLNKFMLSFGLSLLFSLIFILFDTYILKLFYIT